MRSSRHSEPITASSLLLAVLFSPIFALYGLVLLVRGLVRLPARVRATRAALSGGTIACANDHPNPTVGRFECATCHGTYHGWVGECAICGSGAGWVSCEVCQVSIKLPWVRR